MFNNSDTNSVVFSDSDGNLISKDRNSVFTKGMILAWSGTISTIPSGWKLCDGTNETPDLRGRFILGLNSSNNQNTTLSVREMNQKEGNERITLDITQIPPHSHRYWDVRAAGGAGKNIESAAWNDNRSKGMNDTEKTGGRDNVTQPITIMPPFYVLAYIMKT